MARKRDYKAEYARSKERAKAAGYQSERQYKQARKAAHIPRNAMPVPPRILRKSAPEYAKTDRSTARRWSNRHSFTKTSRYDPSWSDEKVEKYVYTFIDPITQGSRRERAAEKRRRLRDWLVPDYMDYDEWKSKYQSV